MKIYEIDQRIAEIFENMTIDETTGEVILDEEALAELREERTKKLEGAALMVRNLEAEAKAIKAEADRLTERKKAAENKAKRIREWLGFALGDEKLKTPMVSVSPIKPKSTAVIDDVDEVVNWWFYMEDSAKKNEVKKVLDVKYPAPTVSRAGLKKLIDEGNKIPGCHLETGKFSATIR